MKLRQQLRDDGDGRRGDVRASDDRPVGWICRKDERAEWESSYNSLDGSH